MKFQAQVSKGKQNDYYYSNIILRTVMTTSNLFPPSQK